MPSFPRPSFTFDYQVDAEISSIRNYRDTEPGRQIPVKTNSRLLVATWNIANLGLQKRTDKDYRIIAEIISWFDVIALQEVNDNLSGLRSIQKNLPLSYRVLFSDKSGNNERMTIIYDSNKVSLLEKVGEIALSPLDIRNIKLPGIKRKFEGFDRNPYVASFQAGSFKFILVNVHLYFGGETKKDQERRSLEAYATARWADQRRKSRFVYLEDIIVLGDFNLPKVEPGDPTYVALTKRGLWRPEHSTRIASNITDDKNYDQIMFFPGNTKEFSDKVGIFDFDGALFRGIWENRTKAEFRAFMRYYISDHRPLWAEFKI